MRTSKIILYIAASALGAGSAAPAGAGVVFTATTKVESPTARLVSLADSTVRGWVDGDRGRVEFLESRNSAWPKGSILLTSDGGRTVRFFDPVARKCRPWAPFAGAGAFPPAATGASATRENLRVEKSLDELGSKVTGFPTHHYRFSIAYDTNVSGVGGVRRSHTDRVDDFWVTPELPDPALAIWPTARAPGTGDERLDGELAVAMAEVRGVPLRRVTVERVAFDGRPPQTTTTTVEVTRLTRARVAASMFLEPFPCKILKPEDRR